MKKYKHLRLKLTLGSFLGVIVIGLIIFAIIRCTQSLPPTSSSEPNTSQVTSQSTSDNIQQHYVYFDLNGYRSIPNPDPQLVNEGSKVMMPGVDRLGYTVSGWTQTPEGGVYWDFNTNVVEASITLYAQWVKDVYTVSFDLNGGTGTKPIDQTTTYLSYYELERSNVLSIPASGDFQKDGYTFDGWWRKDNVGNFIQEWNFASDLPTQDMTLYAGWGVSGEFNHYLYMEYATAVKITGYNDSTYVGGTLLIPDYINSKPVLSIGESAFASFSGTDEIALPDTLTTIQGMAFSSSPAIYELVIPDKVTSIGFFAFSNCANLYTLTLGTSVTNIGMQAFYQCQFLSRFEAIVFPSNVISIDNLAFDSTSANAFLASPEFNEGLIYIGNNAFAHGKFSYVNLPNSLEHIGREAFCYTPMLADIHFGTGLLSIGNQAFAMANSLTPGYLHVYLPSIVPPTLEDPQTFGPFAAPGGNPTRPSLWFIVPEGLIDDYNDDVLWGMYYHGRFTNFIIT